MLSAATLALVAPAPPSSAQSCNDKERFPPHAPVTVSRTGQLGTFEQVDEGLAGCTGGPGHTTPPNGSPIGETGFPGQGGGDITVTLDNAGINGPYVSHGPAATFGAGVASVAGAGGRGGRPSEHAAVGGPGGLGGIGGAVRLTFSGTVEADSNGDLPIQGITVRSDNGAGGNGAQVLETGTWWKHSGDGGSAGAGGSASATVSGSVAASLFGVLVVSGNWDMGQDTTIARGGDGADAASPDWPDTATGGDGGAGGAAGSASLTFASGTVDAPMGLVAAAGGGNGGNGGSTSEATGQTGGNGGEGAAGGTASVTLGGTVVSGDGRVPYDIAIPVQALSLGAHPAPERPDEGDRRRHQAGDLPAAARPRR